MASQTAFTLEATRLEAYAELLRGLAQECVRFRFDVAPNPCVGAAVVSGERIVARGFHEVWGEAHAEINALDAAEQSGVPASQWEVLLVTLEPCSSHGKTPPCIERILQSEIKCVVVGALDPDPRHRGRGLELLRAAGIEVVLLDDTAPLTQTAPHFLTWTDNERIRRPRPWVIAKWAQTRSGQLIPPPGIGDGRWISGPAALQEVQLMRGRVDAILTGVGTILADDPRFTVRPPGNLQKPPTRVVLDSNLRTPPQALLLKPPGDNEAAGPVHILCVGGASSERHSALIAAGATVHELHVATDDGVDLRDALGWLWNFGARRVLLEAGPVLLTHFLSSGFVDQVRIYTGDVNGGQGPSMGHWLSKLRIKERLDRESGDDAVLEGFLREPR